MRQRLREEVGSQYFTSDSILLSFGAKKYVPFGAPGGSADNESEAVIKLADPIIIRRIMLVMAINLMDEATDLNFRDDGVSVATLSIPSAFNGLADSGVINVLVEAESEICLEWDTTPATVQGAQSWFQVVEYKGV